MDDYSFPDKYIHSKTRSNAHQSVYAKESDKYQWLVLKQKSHCEVEGSSIPKRLTAVEYRYYEVTVNRGQCQLYRAIFSISLENASLMMYDFENKMCKI